MKKVFATMIVADFIIILIITKLLFNSTMLLFILPLMTIVACFAFRTYDIEQLDDVNSQIIRNFIASFLSILITYVFFEISKVTIDEVILYSLLSSIALSFFHYFYFPKIRRFLKRKVYYLPEYEYYKLKPILDEIHERSLGSIVFTTDPFNHNSVLIIYEDMKSPEGENTVFLPDLAEKYLNRIPIEILRRFPQYYEIIFQSVKESPAKRVLDVFASIIGIIAFSPIMGIIALAILVEDGFPIVFKQERIGKSEKSFILYKFRSLDKREKNPGYDAQDRVLFIGKIIRKLRLDELLQFINVLKGDMSVVGPRPEMRIFHEKMKNSIPFYRYRLKRKPGITGWAQINYKHTTTYEDYLKKTEYDLWYIKNRNIFIDLRIILQTLETMIGMRGAK